MDTDREFINVSFQFDPSIGCDLLKVKSNERVLMTDTTIADTLEDVAIAVRNCQETKTHFVGCYDFRRYQLPGVSASFARAKQLLNWVEVQNFDLEERLFAVAVVIPAGFRSRLLKKLVEFVIYITQPPMGPKVFEDDDEKAFEFLRMKYDSYKKNELGLKPFDVHHCRFKEPPSLDKIQAFNDKVKEDLERRRKAGLPPPKKYGGNNVWKK